jgi:hypothetical protein
MSEQAFAILLAAAFTSGCAAIYGMRSYARETTGILFRIALCIGPFVALLMIAQQEEGSAHGKAAPPIAHQSLQ